MKNSKKSQAFKTDSLLYREECERIQSKWLKNKEDMKTRTMLNDQLWKREDHNKDGIPLMMKSLGGEMKSNEMKMKRKNTFIK